MTLEKLSFYRSLFLDSLGDRVISDDSLLKSEILVIGEDLFSKYLISIQARVSQSSTKEFLDRMKEIESSGVNFLPIFVGGYSSNFIYFYKGRKERVRNTGERVDNVYGVQEKVKKISQFQNGRVIVLSPEETLGRGYPVLKVSQTKPVYGKSYFNSDVREEPLGAHSSDKKYETSELYRALHFIRPFRKIRLEDVCFRSGRVLDRNNFDTRQFELL